MTTRSLIAAAALCLTLLACMGGQDATEGADAGPVPLSEPWQELDLPIEEGAVYMSDARKLSAGYTGRSVLETTEAWFGAAQRSGFVATGPEADGALDDELNHGIFASGEEELTITVMQGVEQVLVVATLAPRELEEG